MSDQANVNLEREIGGLLKTRVGPATDAIQRRPTVSAEKTVGQRLAGLGTIYDERGALYGKNYHKAGKVIEALFPDGKMPQLKTADDANRLHLVIMILSKLSRYCWQFDQGGHVDSLDDMAVYAQMLQEVDELTRAGKL